MSKIDGTKLIGMITPNGDSANTFPTHEDIYGKGGYMVTTRGSIPYDRRKVGMLVYDTSESKIFKCTNVGSSGKFDATWEEFKTTDLDDLEIGGRNLLKNSQIGYWHGGYNTNGEFLKTIEDNRVKLVKKLPLGEYNSIYALLNPAVTNLNIKAGETYTFQVEIECDKALPNNHLFVRHCNKDNSINDAYGYFTVPMPTNTPTQCVLTCTFKKDVAVDEYLYFVFETRCTDQITLYVTNTKIEKGNKPTDWTPALEDYLDLTTMKALSAKTADSANSASVANYAKYITETDNHNLNSFAPGELLISHNYNYGTLPWSNAPTGFLYGCVLLLPCLLSVSTIVTLLAFDMPLRGSAGDGDSSKGTTRNFWVRTGNPNYYTSEKRLDTTITTQDASWNLSEWKRVAWASELQGTAPNPIEITRGDLNDYKTPGFYYCNLDEYAAKISNTPTSTAFSLVVKKAAGVTLEFTTYPISGWKKYERHFYSNSWGSWKLVSGAADIYLPLTGGTLTGKLRVNYASDNYTLTKANLFNDDAKTAVDGAALTIGGIGNNGTLRLGISRASLLVYAVNPEAVLDDGTKGNKFVTDNLTLLPLGGSVIIGPTDTKTNLTMTSGSSPKVTIGPASIKYNSSTGCLEITC